MKTFSWILKIFLVALLAFFISNSSALHVSKAVLNSTDEFLNYTAISEFKVLNRKKLDICTDPNPYLQINFTTKSGKLSDEEFIQVTVSGVILPAKSHWVALISPAYSNASSCPFNELQYAQTGDISKLPLLCHYPVKAQYVHNDPDYMTCKKTECKKYLGPICLIKTCSATLTFHMINIRTDIEFVLFAGDFESPCILTRSSPAAFANPSKPLYGHVSSVDSNATSMRLTWVSGDNHNRQYVQYGDGKSVAATYSTFTRDNMCGGEGGAPNSPAKDFGWHDPGYIHSAIMTGLKPSTAYSYRYGSNSTGWSDEIVFRTPPARGSDKLSFIAFGDMGKYPRDLSVEHYVQPGSISVVKAIAKEISSGIVDSIFHTGDISYATGFLVEWDFFLHHIYPVASKVPYMTAIGNHERDYVFSGSVYPTPDSGGECGIPYDTYFPMPTTGTDRPWYSIEQGPVHFIVISTEHPWSHNSEQYNWMMMDMKAVNRSVTPWLIFMEHRPMYSSGEGIAALPNVDKFFVNAVEPLLLSSKVDVVLSGHVHNYERSCAVYRSKCKAMPKKDAHGVDTYYNSKYAAPVHAIIGMGGFKLDGFTDVNNSWSLVRISKFGYVRVHANQTQLKFEFVNSHTSNIEDTFRIVK